MVIKFPSLNTAWSNHSPPALIKSCLIEKQPVRGLPMATHALASIQPRHGVIYESPSQEKFFP